MPPPCSWVILYPPVARRYLYRGNAVKQGGRALQNHKHFMGGVWSISEKTEGANTGGGEGAKFANPDVQVVPLGARGTIRRRVQTDLRQLLLYPVGGQRR